LAGPHTQELDLTKLLPSPHYCASCAERVCAEVTALEGVIDVQCDLQMGALTITHDARRLSSADLEERVRRIALEATGSVEHAAYRLTGLD